MTSLFVCIRRVAVVVVVVAGVVTQSCSASSSDGRGSSTLFDKQSYPDTTTTAADILDTKKLDCGIRSLALEYAKKILIMGSIDMKTSYDDDDIIQAVHDALELTHLCEIEMPKNATNDHHHQILQLRHNRPSLIADTTTTTTTASEVDTVLTELCNDPVSSNDNNRTICIFVSPQLSEIHDDDDTDKNGSIDQPWSSIHQALRHIRSLTKRQHQHQHHNKGMILFLRQGVHYLRGRPLRLTNLGTAKLTVRGYPGEEVWISGGVKLKDVEFKKATSNDIHHPDGVYVADLSDVLKGYNVPNTPSLFTSSQRYIRARYPNSNPEVDQWGYSSPNHSDYSFRSDDVLEWTKPSPGTPPNFTFVDFAKNPPPGVPFKNNSSMEGYNQYASGRGGVCSEIWGDEADSYWCSNASQGGWAEVDRECAISGQMQLPIGMMYNRSSESLVPLQNASSSLKGGIIHAWHSQSWAMHMFEITSHSQVNATMTFAPGGGKQGGRNWCRCDQCTYAGGWCGQHESPPRDDDTRLISGNWMIENVKYFLDQPGEYYFDKETSFLYIKPNSTDDLQDLTLGMLTELIDLRNTSNIRIEDLSFRDQASTYMEEGWSAPSGGDWSLRRGGAIFIENASNVTISGCNFFRLDGNAIFLSKKTRHVHIEYNHFEWIGENAIATWGDTNGYDATAGEYPMYTLIQHNVMRELGIYEKQSSAVGICKAALTTIRNNIMFNMPRAAINFNDLVGGGDVVEGNLIFNTCRESGDHGPINSWDRQPFLTNLRDGKTNSFDPLSRIIRHNFIIANYNAAQGVDNDDGSSWFHIHHNLFYMADGFKMDYGGHDSIFEYNMVMSFCTYLFKIARFAIRSLFFLSFLSNHRPRTKEISHCIFLKLYFLYGAMLILLAYHGGPCFGMGGFLEGHGDILRGNRCLVGLHDNYDDDDETSDCEDDNDSSCYTSKRTTKAMATTTKTKSLSRASGTAIIIDDNDDDEPPFVGRLWGGCEDSYVTLVSNEYYTPDGIALIGCNGKDFYNLNDMATKFGLEVNSTNGALPDVDTILEWATSIVMEKQEEEQQPPPPPQQQKSSSDVVSVLTTEYLARVKSLGLFELVE